MEEALIPYLLRLVYLRGAVTKLGQGSMGHNEIIPGKVRTIEDDRVRTLRRSSSSTGVSSTGRACRKSKRIARWWQ